MDYYPEKSMIRKEGYAFIVCVVVAFVILAFLIYNNLKFANEKLEKKEGYDFFAELFYEDFSYDYGYIINGTDFYAEVERPWLGLIDENGILVTSAKINFEEPLQRDTVIQVYFSTEELIEDQSRTRIAKKGTREIVLNFPRNTYRELRFDIRGSFKLSSIQLSNNVIPSIEDKRICINTFLVLFLILDVIYLFQKYFISVIEKKIFSNQILRFAFFSIVWGIAFSFLIIPWQTPDEYSHLQMIGKGIKNENIAKVLFEEMPLDRDRIMFCSEEKIYKSQVKQVMKTFPSYNIYECLPKGIGRELIRHFPATLGIVLGILLRVPAYWTLILGKIFSLIFYVSICCIVLKIVPIQKELFEIVMLLPMCIQQAVSISYDAVLIPMCFLLMAYVLYLKFTVTEICMRDVMTLFGILAYIALTKIPYIILGGIILILPIEKVQLHIGKYSIRGEEIRKWRGIIYSSIFIIMLLILYLYRDNEWLKIVFASICQLPQTLYLFRESWNKFSGELLISLVGNFGYLDTPTALWFVCGEIASIVIISMTQIKFELEDDLEEKKVWKGRDRAVIYLTCLASVYFVTLSMVGHTVGIMFFGTEAISAQVNWREALYQIPFIGGLQGRYYIPMFLLVLLPMFTILNIKEKVYKIFYYSFFIIAVVYTCNVIYSRFWY